MKKQIAFILLMLTAAILLSACHKTPSTPASSSEEPSQEGHFRYLPVKLECVNEQGSYVITVELNERNLPVKQTELKKGEPYRVTEYLYNESGLLTKTVYKQANGSSTSAENFYNEDGLCVKNLSYNAEGNVEAVVETAYNEDGQAMTVRITSHTEGGAYTHESSYTYNASGQLIQCDTTVNNATQTASYTYHENGKLKTEVVTDFGGHQTTLTYDQNGNLLRQEALGECHEREYTYNENGAPLRVLAPDYVGGKTAYDITYDEHGNPIQVVETTANGKTNTYTFAYKRVWISNGADPSTAVEAGMLFTMMSTLKLEITVQPPTLLPDPTLELSPTP